MTVVQRRRPEPVVHRRAPLGERFPKGLRVRVDREAFGGVYSEHAGTVVGINTDRCDIYPGGRVQVRFKNGIIIGSMRPVHDIWFKPSDLEKL